MRTAVFLILFSIMAISCNSNASNGVDESITYDQNVDSMKNRCRELSGVGDFKIGKTTFKEASKSKLFKSYYGPVKSNFSGVSKWGSDDDVIRKKLNEDHRVKMLFNNGYGLRIGDISLWSIALAFFRDTLVAVDFKPEMEEAMLKHYEEKYGEGVGSKKYQSSFPNRGKDIVVTESTKRFWYNESVEISYRKESHLNSQRRWEDYHDEYFLVYDCTGRYTLFLATVEDIKKKGQEEKALSKKESYDMF